MMLYFESHEMETFDFGRKFHKLMAETERKCLRAVVSNAKDMKKN